MSCRSKLGVISIKGNKIQYYEKTCPKIDSDRIRLVKIMKILKHLAQMLENWGKTVPLKKNKR